MKIRLLNSLLLHFQKWSLMRLCTSCSSTSWTLCWTWHSQSQVVFHMSGILEIPIALRLAKSNVSQMKAWWSWLDMLHLEDSLTALDVVL